MKWNFESKSEQRDNLHNHLVSRCNSFCSAGKLSKAPTVRSIAGASIAASQTIGLIVARALFQA
jgi:hypothetical protein